MELTVEIKNVYGNELIYPADPNSYLLAQLIGAKTFNKSQIATLKKLGYTFAIAAKEL